MKKSTAIQHLRILRTQLQKARGREQDAYQHLQNRDECLAALFPWMFGKKCPLEVMSKVLDRVDSDGTLEPGNYFSFASVFARFLPAVYASAQYRAFVDDVPELLPIEDLPLVLAGWDVE